MSEERTEREALLGIERALSEIARVIVEEHVARRHRAIWRIRLRAWARRSLRLK